MRAAKKEKKIVVILRTKEVFEEFELGAKMRKIGAENRIPQNKPTITQTI